MTLSVRVLTGARELDAHARDPTSAFSRATDLRLGNDAAYLGAIAERLRPEAAEFLVLESVGEPLALVPAFADYEERQGLRCALRGTPLGLGLDLSDVLLLPAARTREGIREVIRHVSTYMRTDLACFTRVPERSHLEVALKGESRLVTRLDAGRSAWCDVSSATALDVLSKNQLRNIERLERRAERDFGAVEVTSFTEPSVIAGAFERFLAIEDSGWKGAQSAGTSLLNAPILREFLRCAAARFATSGGARVDVLTIGGRDAAAQLGFRTGDTWYLQKIGYVPEFKDIGPGAILLREFLERMVADPTVNEVNFVTDPRWADRWHFRSEPCYTVVVHGSTWRGRARSVHDRLKDAVRVLQHRLVSASTRPSP